MRSGEVFVCLHTLASLMKTWRARTIADSDEMKHMNESDDRMKHRLCVKKGAESFLCNVLFTVLYFAVDAAAVFYYSVRFSVMPLKLPASVESCCCFTR